MIQNKYIVRLSLIGLFVNIIVNMIHYRYFIIEEMILKRVGQENVRIAEVYTRNVWERHKVSVNKIHKFGYMNLLQDEDFIKFANITVDIFGNLNANISLYDLQGNKMISSYPIKLTKKESFSGDHIYKKIMDRIDKYFLKEIIVKDAFNKAFYGMANHILIPKAIIERDNKLEKASFITSYIPIIGDELSEYPVEAVLEINTNITDLWSSIVNLERKVLLTFGVILVIFFTIIMSNTSYAQKIIDQQLEDNNKLEQAVIRVKNENSAHTKFFANVSHELRTPLNAIIGFSEIIMSDPYNKEHDNYIKDINNSGKHLLSVINDILDLSKASFNKLTVDFIKLDLNKLITSTIRIMKPRADEAKVQLVEIMSNNHIIIEADPKRLKQVFFNLLSNALKFTEPFGTVTISAEQDESKGLVYIKIVDTGIGIDEKDIPKVLSNFGQIDSTLGRKYPGTGLGLPLTQKLVELMKGKFDIQSKIGVGTTVTLIFNYNGNIEV